MSEQPITIRKAVPLSTAPKIPRRKPNHALIAEAESDALEFADKANYWMKVSAALTLMNIVSAFYIAITLLS